MDYIEVLDENNNSNKMEVVCTFKLKNYNYNYIIYRELDKSHYYLAKYLDNKDDLITDFDDKEFEEATKVFEEVTNETRN